MRSRTVTAYAAPPVPAATTPTKIKRVSTRLCLKACAPLNALRAKVASDTINSERSERRHAHPLAPVGSSASLGGGVNDNCVAAYLLGCPSKWRINEADLVAPCCQ